jgi:hypothetical protein
MGKLFVVLFLLFGCVKAEAHHHKHQHHYTHVISQGQVVSHPSGCPSSAFCGCGAAVHLFGAPIRSLWLAASWFRFPPASPAPGMVAVRSHHVMVIEHVTGPRTAVVFDANSGHHLTRVHEVSLAGYSIRNPRM